MVNIRNILSGGAQTAGKAKDEMTKTTRRKFVSGVGLTALGLGTAELATDGAVSETAGDWWEEVLEDPMGLNVQNVNDFNTAVNNFEDAYDGETDQNGYHQDLHEAQLTENVGRVTRKISEGDSFDDGQYKALGFNSEDINNSDGNALIERVVEDEEFTVLTPDAIKMSDSESFGSEYGAVAIDQDENEFDESDLREIKQAYEDAAAVTGDWISRASELEIQGESFDRVSKEYEDEEEVPAVTTARDNIEYLEDLQRDLAKDQLRFRTQASLFDHALQNSPYDDGEEVGVDQQEETDTPTETPTDTPTETAGDHDEYGDISEYCDFSDSQIHDLNEYMSSNNIESYDEFDVEVHSTEGDFTVELTYEDDTISLDNVEGCGA